MKLFMTRREFSRTTTISTIDVDHQFFGYICEDTDRKLEEGGEKVPGKTAIPRGRYQVILDWSNRFKRVLPRLLDVPQFTGVRIHPGNTCEDTEGCLLPGLGTDFKVSVFNSRAAFEALFSRMEDACERGEEIWIEIT